MAAKRQGKSHGSGPMHGVLSDKIRYLKPITKTSIPQNLVFIDCESKCETSDNGLSEVQFLRLGVAIGVRREAGRWVRRSVLRFTEPEQFWEWLVNRTSKRRPVWLFAHNLCVDSTWVGTWERVDEGALVLSEICETCGKHSNRKCKSHTGFRGTCVISDPPIILSFLTRNGPIRMIDTMNYWKTSVAKIGIGIGHEKLMRPPDSYSPGEWFDYCQRDAEIIERAVCGVMDEWESEDCGHWGMTAAQLGFSSFRRTLKSKEILINHEEPHTSLERASYYGGQAEAYFIGKVDEPVWLYDVRSLYPSKMLTHWFPVQFLRMGKELDTKKCLAWMQFHAAIARVKVKIEGEGLPKRIPYDQKDSKQRVKVRIGGQVQYAIERLAFPVGTYTTVLAGPELMQALIEGTVIEILEIAWYRQAQIFREFVEKWFNKRPFPVTPETFARDLLCKTVLNSMSGYFAKHSMRWKDRPELAAVSRWGQWWGKNCDSGKVTKFRAIAGLVQELTEKGESRDSVPAIAAYITSYGRLQMRALRQLCPAHSILYQDTDSLMCLGAAKASLEARGLIGIPEIGKLIEKGYSESCYIHAVKDYEWGGQIVASGIKADATKIAPGRFSQEQWDGLPGILSRVPDGTVTVHREIVQLSRDRYPRTPTGSGWTLPPRLEDDSFLPF